MIIARAPYRLSFFGGGTDYPAWSESEGGAVLSTSIDRYCYVSVRHLPPFFANRHRVVWSHIETISQISEILHPAVREGLRMLDFDDAAGLEIHHQGDLPARAGMGSSSAFAVALLQALTAFRGKMISKDELAASAIELEQRRLQENVGSQDQVAVAFGGFNRIAFRTDGTFEVQPITLDPGRIEELKSRLMLFYTGTSRLSSEVAGDVIANLQDQRSSLLRMRAMVDEAIEILASGGDLDPFGELLHETWQLKRKLSTKVAPGAIDDIYGRATKAGALGGKLLGAGGSGFMVFFVPEKKQDAVLRALSNHVHVPFDFEADGSRVIHYSDATPLIQQNTRRRLASREGGTNRATRSAAETARAGMG